MFHNDYKVRSNTTGITILPDNYQLPSPVSSY